MSNEDYNNLPSLENIKHQEMIPLLASLGVISIETDTTTVVNGEYLQYTKINESYLMTYDQPQSLNVIDITDMIKSNREERNV